MTFGEAKQALARKLDIDYADIANNGLFTDDDLTDYIQSGVLRAWDYKPWDVAEEVKTLTVSAQNITDGFIDYPADILSGSISLLRVNSKSYKRVQYKDYLKYFENRPAGTEKIWAEFRQFIFINPNALSLGDTVDILAKNTAFHYTTASDLMPFSPDTDNREYSGNHAIVLLAYSEALSSEKKKNPNQAAIEEKRAYTILDILWRQFSQNRSLDQSQSSPMFNVPDYFEQNNPTTNTNIGRFNIL